MWTKLARQVHRWKALHSLLELIARTLTVRFRSLLRVKRIMTFILFFKPKFYKNRGLHVVQEWKSGPRTLSEGGSQSDAMCNRLVCILFVWTFLLLIYICYQLIRLTKMRENCLQQFDAHWECLEKRNQVCISDSSLLLEHTMGRKNRASFISIEWLCNFAHLTCSNF